MKQEAFRKSSALVLQIDTTVISFALNPYRAKPFVIYRFEHSKIYNLIAEPLQYFDNLSSIPHPFTSLHSMHLPRQQKKPADSSYLLHP